MALSNFAAVTRKPRLYLAAALRKAYQRQYLEALTARLEQHYEVYLPHRNGGFYPDMIAQARTMRDAAELVTLRDTEAVERADLLLAVLFNEHVDAGVAFEYGFACAVRVPCFALAPDVTVSAALNPLIYARTKAWLQNWEQCLPIRHPELET